MVLLGLSSKAETKQQEKGRRYEHVIYQHRLTQDILDGELAGLINVSVTMLREGTGTRNRDWTVYCTVSRSHKERVGGGYR